MKKNVLLLFLIVIFFNVKLIAQDCIATNITNETIIRGIITNKGFILNDKAISEINTSTLNNAHALAIFNGSQGWNGIQLFNSAQVSNIVSFVNSGGCLYISARKGYDNLLTQFGVSTSGIDGGTTGFNWPIIMQKATNIISHQLTQNVNIIKGDVGASFSLTNDWTVLGYNNNNTVLLATRHYGQGKIVLWYGQRSFRNPGSTSNVYETDISQGNNNQFYNNVFENFKNHKNYFITESHNLDNNLVPTGWTFYEDLPSSNIANGRMNAYVVDAEGLLIREGVMPPSTGKLIVEWDGDNKYSYWGRATCLVLK